MRYALIGAAGFVAPRHMAAIAEAGGELVTACDISDSVGVLDRYWPDCRFHRVRYIDEFDFWKDLDDVDCVVVCSPNWLHSRHVSFALGYGKQAVCEKPLYTQGAPTWMNSKPGHVFPVLQLRHHPDVEVLRDALTGYCAELEIDYVVHRGPWYWQSWKGDAHRSGGILHNIGVHLFDLALYIGGDLVGVEQAMVGRAEASGVFRLENARVKWHLAVSNDPQATRREFVVGPVRVDFSRGMTDLHAEHYRAVERGEGWDLRDVKRSLDLIQRIKEAGR